MDYDHRNSGEAREPCHDKVPEYPNGSPEGKKKTSSSTWPFLFIGMGASFFLGSRNSGWPNGPATLHHVSSFSSQHAMEQSKLVLMGADESGDDDDEEREEQLIKTSYSRADDASTSPIAPTKATSWDLGLETSVWCEGSTLETRRCSFRNLCFQPHWENHLVPKFIFFVGENSTFLNLPLDEPEDVQKLLDLSSTPGHLKFTMRYEMLPATPSAYSSFDDVEIIDQRTLIVHRQVPNNLYHVLHDDVLPIYFTMQDLCAGNVKSCVDDMLLFYTDEKDPGPLFPFYKPLSTKNHVFRRYLEGRGDSSKRLFCLRQAHAGLIKRSLWYDVGVNYDFEAPLSNATITGTELADFTEFYIKELCSSEDPDGILWCTPDHTCKSRRTPSAVILSRKKNRRILNENDVANYLRQYYSERFGEDGDDVVELLSMEEDVFLAQICSVRNAEIVIGMHGAMLTLTLFSRPGTIVIEMFPFGIDPDHMTAFRTLSALPHRHVIHLSWSNANETHSVPHPEYPSHNGGIGTLWPDDVEFVTKTVPVPRLPCCDHPLLLYRLYQDTAVDLKELEQLLNTGFHRRDSL